MVGSIVGLKFPNIDSPVQLRSIFEVGFESLNPYRSYSKILNLNFDQKSLGALLDSKKPLKVRTQLKCQIYSRIWLKLYTVY